MYKILFVSIFLGLSSFCLAQKTALKKQFFSDTDRFLSQYVSNGKVDYIALKKNPSDLIQLLLSVENCDLSQAEDNEAKAFMINAYNLIVIKSVILDYPINSTQEVAGFFTKKDHKVAGEQMSLDELENKYIRPLYNDPRIHFVLVCGALGCPPIIPEAYWPEKLDTQLDQQTELALNNSDFIRLGADGEKVTINPIFDWYAKDFGNGKQGVLEFINQYRSDKIPTNYKVGYYDYSWVLNDTRFGEPETIISRSPTNSEPSNIEILPLNPNRYTVSAALRKGQFEIQLFNNLYSEKGRDAEGEFANRYSFFTTSAQFLYGLSPRLSIGMEGRFRSVAQNHQKVSSLFEVFKFGNQGFVNDGYSRIALTSIGPRIKYTPIKSMGNISFQHTLTIPTGKNLSGSDTQGFIDWNGLSIFNQFFFDQFLGDKASVFLELDVNLENIGKDNDAYLSLPVTTIVSYFPHRKLTFYALVNMSTRWYDIFTNTMDFPSYDPFGQVGLGSKFLITQNIELEFLYTQFFKSNFNGRAATYNLGIRITN